MDDRAVNEIHVVKEGDTLYKIAKMHGLKVVDLLRANPFVNIYNLQVGEELVLPIKSIPEEDFMVPYIIKDTDTIESILKSSGMRFEDLAKKNPFLWQIKLPAKNVLFLPPK